MFKDLIIYTSDNSVSPNFLKLAAEKLGYQNYRHYQAQDSLTTVQLPALVVVYEKRNNFISQIRFAFIDENNQSVQALLGFEKVEVVTDVINVSIAEFTEMVVTLKNQGEMIKLEQRYQLIDFSNGHFIGE